MPKRKSTATQGDVESGVNSRATLIISPYLYLGPRAASSPSFIEDNGITCILSIGAQPMSNVASVVYHRLALSDKLTSSIDAVCDKAISIIDSAKSGHGKILVHCSAAVSRSPTIVAAYLMTKCDMSLKDALGTIIRARPAVNPNATFFRQLKELEVRLHGECSLDVDSLPAKRNDRVNVFVP